MNIQTESDLVVIPRENALEVYTAEGAILPYLERVQAEVDAFLAEGTTAETAGGRKQIRSMAFRVAKTRTALEAVGKRLAEDVKAIPKKVDATRRMVRETLESMEEEVRRPLTEYEAAEAERVAGHEAALAALIEPPGYGATETPGELRERLDHLRAMLSRNWQEFAERAAQTVAAEVERTERLLAAAVKREADAAELAVLRAEQEKRAAADAAAIAEAATAAFVAARVEVERKRAEEAAADAIARAEKAEADKLAAEQAAVERERRAAAQAEAGKVAAIEAERRRVAAAQAEVERQAAAREADVKHRGAINRGAALALVAEGIDPTVAKAVITLIAQRKILNVTITY